MPVSFPVSLPDYITSRRLCQEGFADIAHDLRTLLTVMGGLPGGPARRGAAAYSGLGLTIARSLVELHGGAISVQSTPGRGTRFAIELPAA